MPKKIKYESCKYQFLMAASRYQKKIPTDRLSAYCEYLSSLIFTNIGNSTKIHNNNFNENVIEIDHNSIKLYKRADKLIFKNTINSNENVTDEYISDDIMEFNKTFFDEVFIKMIKKTEFNIEHEKKLIDNNLHIKERDFHDLWANSEDLKAINVGHTNEVCTSPEMRFITKRLGSLKGVTLLDVGCGLGEASVYFAMLGASVTATDLSQGMLNACSELAKMNSVSVKTHLSAAENMQLDDNIKFDIIYAGNLFHHVDIESTIIRLKPHLAKDGCLITWDPIKYNPVINIYRKMAMDVRTPDEHPLGLKDIKTFKKHFQDVETKYTWLTTLIIFVIMFMIQRRNPNKERFWKVVVRDGDKWKWLYKPLEIIDIILIKIIPPLKLLCWNVIIISKKQVN